MRYSSAYHPQSDGQSELVNRCVETYLQCFVGSKPKQWPRWLSWAKYWYNTNYNSATKTTPFQAMYGRQPPTLWRDVSSSSPNEEVYQLMEDRNHMLDELREQLLKAQNRMKMQADKHRRNVTYQVGDKVFLKVQPYRLKPLAKRINQKLSPRFYGLMRSLRRWEQQPINCNCHRILGSIQSSMCPC